MTVFDAAEKYRAEAVPLIILAGKEYGSGSSRDWAAKGPLLLGVRAVIAESFERIHRSNLVGMGILPLQFPSGQTADSLGLTGEEVYDKITGLKAVSDRFKPGAHLHVRAVAGNRTVAEFDAPLRIDTPQEALYLSPPRRHLEFCYPPAIAGQIETRDSVEALSHQPSAKDRVSTIRPRTSRARRCVSPGNAGSIWCSIRSPVPVWRISRRPGHGAAC